MLRFCAAQAGAAAGGGRLPGDDAGGAARLRRGARRRGRSARGCSRSRRARPSTRTARARARARAGRRPRPAGRRRRHRRARTTAIWHRVRSLPGKQRSAVALRYLADLSHREIAEVMGTSEDAARRNVFEGLRRLREHGEGRDDMSSAITANTRTLQARRCARLGRTCGAQLDERGLRGHASRCSSADECEALADLFDGGRFRSTIDMARYRFGDGRYRYFDNPLPDAIGELRGAFYRHLAPIANDWSSLLGGDDGRVSARARGAARALPRGRAGAPDAADPALRGGRLERPPPGSLRRRLLPVPGADRSLRARRRLRGRRVRAARAAPARAEPGARRGRAARRVRRSSRPTSAPAGRARLSQGRPAPRREHVTRGSRTALGIIFHDAR